MLWPRPDVLPVRLRFHAPADAGNCCTGLAATGPWLSNAKLTLSWTNCAAYLPRHQHDEHANELWHCFQDVIRWVRSTFTMCRSETQGLAWGALYNQFGKEMLSPEALEADIQSLVADEDVTKKSGIYPYVRTRQEKPLNIRAFTPK